MAADTSQTVDKALRIFDFFSDKEELGISELAVKMNSDKSTVFRLLGSLTNAGFLQKDEVTKKFRLGLRLRYLGELVTERNEVSKQALPLMKKISEKYQVSTLLCELENNQTRVLEKVSAGPLIYMTARVGVTMQPYSMASGKLLLAYSGEQNIEEYLSAAVLEAQTPHTITDKGQLREHFASILANGYAEDNEESNIGLCCLSVPVIMGGQKDVLALDASGLSDTIRENKPQLLIDLKEAALALAMLAR